MLLGAAAVIVAPELWFGGAPWRFGHGALRGLASGQRSAAGSSRSAEQAPSLPPASPSAEPVNFAEPRLIDVAAAPLDVVITDDDASFIVLGADGAVRVYELTSGKELRKIIVPGKGSELRLLAGRYIAVIGAASALPIIDLTTYTVGRIDLGGAAVDVVALSGAPSLVAASGLSRKVMRFSLDGFRLEGQVLLSRPVSGLSVTRAGAGGREVGGREMLVVLSQDKGAFGLGAVDIFDPAATPFGGSRRSFTSAVNPRCGAESDAPALVASSGQSQLIEMSLDRPPRITRVDQHPLSAYRLSGGWVVTVNAGGTATVLGEATLEPRATLSLGAEPSSVAVVPFGRALLIALGRGPGEGGSRGERGATTTIIAGDPPTVTATLETGPGSHSVRIGKSGRFAAVAAYSGRSVAILERRPSADDRALTAPDRR
jgi:hypothetical protein